MSSTEQDTGPEAVRVRLAPPPGEPLYIPRELAAVPGLFEVPVAPRPRGVRFVYFLCQSVPSPPGHPAGLLVDYVGETTTLGRRIEQHARDRRRDGLPPFVRVFAAAVEAGRARHVEESLIRLMQPPYLAERARGFRPVDADRLGAWGYHLGAVHGARSG